MNKCYCFHIMLSVFLSYILTTPLHTITYAQELPSANYEVRQLPSGEVEIIVPAKIKDKEKEKEKEPNTDEIQAIADAKKDVKAHFNQTLWFTTGCFLPIIGPFVSQRDIKSIPAARTLGKSPQYVAFYIDYYEIYMKRQRYNWALGGCIVGGLTDVCLLGIIINANTN